MDNHVKVDERLCIVPGSFDPITNGHMDVIERASALFDRVIVAVLHNAAKPGALPMDKRLAMIEKAIGGMDGVSAEAFSGLLIDFARLKGAQVFVKGMRNVTDFDYEYQIAALNRQLAPEIETILLMTGMKHAFVSSSMVRDIAAHGGDITGFVPAAIVGDLQAFYGRGAGV